MKPLKNRVLAEIITSEKKTASGIILPESHKTKYRAKVLFTGPKVEFLKVGDIVKYHQGQGAHYIHNDKNCLFLKEDIDIDFVE